MRHLFRGLRAGADFAFQVIDSSAKWPSASVKGSISSYGDFDQCLAVSSLPLPEPESTESTSSLSSGGKDAVRATSSSISSQTVSQSETQSDKSDNFVAWDGSYCMVDIMSENLLPNETLDDGLIHINRPFMFSHVPMFHGLCFPSVCSEADVRSLVAHILKPFPLRAEGDVSCVTRNTISYTHRLQNMTRGQVVAVLFLLSIAGFVAIGTLIELSPLSPIPLKVESMIPPIVTKIFRSFGLMSNMEELMRPETKSHCCSWTGTKLVVICSGVFAHICCCLETPLGFFVLSHHQQLADIVTNTFTQFFFNDGGLTIVTFLSAFASYHALGPAIRDRRLKYGLTIADRWLRFAPPVMVITAMDYVWPLLFSGPLYSRVGNWITNKCGNNWWYNLFFISVYFPALDLCAPHTYYASIDFNMFVIGLLAIFLLMHKRRAGIAFCIAGIVIGNVLLLYFTWFYQITPSVVTSRSPSQFVVNYLDVVQMSLYPFFCSYFTGLLLADVLSHGFRAKIVGWKDHVMWTTSIYVTLTITETSTALHNTWHVLPQSLVPLYIVCNRLLFLACIVLLVIYLSSIGKQQQEIRSDAAAKRKKDDDEPAADVNDEETKAKASTNPHQETDGMMKLRAMGRAIGDLFSSRAMVVLTRLSFSIFMVNYYFIRTDFFVTRVPIDPGIYTLVKRLLYSSFYITVLAFMFQVTVVGPFGKIRKLMDYRTTMSPAVAT